MGRIKEMMGAFAPSPGWKEPTTSRDAALSFGSSKASTLRERLLAALAAAPAGLTADEAATILGATPFAIRPRFTELKDLERIEKNGAKRPNESGMMAAVWILRPRRPQS